MTKLHKTKLVGLAIALGLSANASAQLMINGAGATFPYPIYSVRPVQLSIDRFGRRAKADNGANG